MAHLAEPKVFNNQAILVAGWYWLVPSKKVKKERAVPVRFFGKDLVVYRGADRKVRAMSAYCPHMGAHLAEGSVKGNAIQCMFHGWRFDETGHCQEIPCLERTIQVKKLDSYKVREELGLIWIWTGDEEPGPFPEVPELCGQKVSYRHGRPFVKNCHPNVMMINAIDAQHFNTVHPLVKKLAGGAQLLLKDFSHQAGAPAKSGLHRQLKSISIFALNV